MPPSTEMKPLSCIAAITASTSASVICLLKQAAIELERVLTERGLVAPGFRSFSMNSCALSPGDFLPPAFTSGMSSTLGDRAQNIFLDLRCRMSGSKPPSFEIVKVGRRVLSR